MSARLCGIRLQFFNLPCSAAVYQPKEASMVLPVILAGGSGSRLWPLSRAQHPKQFHALTSGEMLLVDTARRVPNGAFAPPLIITNEQSRFSVAAAFKQANLAHQGIVLEPAGRSTAPAAAVAA